MSEVAVDRSVLDFTGRYRNISDDVVEEPQALEEIQALLAQQAKPLADRPEWVDLLGVCCGRNWLQASALLIDAGVQFSSNPSYRQREEFDGISCHYVMLEAASAPGTEILDFLEARGAQVDIVTDYDETALHWATSFGRPNSISWLLSRNLPIHLANNHGETPFYLLCSGQLQHIDLAALDDEMVDGVIRGARILLEAGADPDVKTHQGVSAREEVEKMVNSSWRNQLLEMLDARDQLLALEQSTAPAQTQPSRAPRL